MISWREIEWRSHGNEKSVIKDLPVSEQPYAKAEKYGVNVLSDAELLAIIIRSGSKSEHSVELATRVLLSIKSNQNLNGLHHVTMHELMKISGIGKVKALQLLCLAEISKRMVKLEAEQGYEWQTRIQLQIIIWKRCDI